MCGGVSCTFRYRNYLPLTRISRGKATLCPVSSSYGACDLRWSSAKRHVSKIWTRISRVVKNRDVKINQNRLGHIYSSNDSLILMNTLM